MNLEELKFAIFSKGIIITFHAEEEMVEDELTLEDVKHSMNNSQIIEEYPTSKPLPSCLVLSFTEDHTPIHTVWGYDELTKRAVLVTVYRPDPKRWVEYRKRRK